MKVVAITGNSTRPSKTHALAECIVNMADGPDDVVKCWDLVDLHPELGAVIWPSDAPQKVKQVLEDITSCDVLVVGTPVYKASYTGLLKHLFDLVDMKALKGRNVVAFATGKAPAHGPLVQSSMRALFAFFDAHVSQNFIFAVDEDFEDGFPSARLQEAARREFEAAYRLAGA